MAPPNINIIKRPTRPVSTAYFKYKLWAEDPARERFSDSFKTLGKLPSPTPKTGLFKTPATLPRQISSRPLFEVSSKSKMLRARINDKKERSVARPVRASSAASEPPQIAEPIGRARTNKIRTGPAMSLKRLITVPVLSRPHNQIIKNKIALAQAPRVPERTTNKRPIKTASRPGQRLGWLLLAQYAVAKINHNIAASA